EVLAVDQHDPSFDLRDIAPRFGRERRRRDHYTLARPEAFEAAHKRLNHRSSDRRLPALRLEIDQIETELVLADYAVYPFIPTLAERLASILPGTAITHGYEHIDDELLEERGRRRLDPI